jgi:dipeptidase
MACTTLLVGKKVSYNGATLIARNDDSPTGVFHVKKLVVVEPKDQPRHYQSVLSHVKVELARQSLTLYRDAEREQKRWHLGGRGCQFRERFDDGDRDHHLEPAGLRSGSLCGICSG